MNRNWIYCSLIILASLQSVSVLANSDSESEPLLLRTDPRSNGFMSLNNYSHKARINLAITLSLLITASTNYAFPEETIGYFTNQLSAEIIAATARDVPIFKKLAVGSVASLLAGCIDWYYMYPTYKRKLALGVAGTQTCIMFIRDWLLEDGLGIRLPRINQAYQRFSVN